MGNASGPSLEWSTRGRQCQHFKGLNLIPPSPDKQMHIAHSADDGHEAQRGQSNMEGHTAGNSPDSRRRHLTFASDTALGLLQVGQVEPTHHPLSSTG